MLHDTSNKAVIPHLAMMKMIIRRFAGSFILTSLLPRGGA
jgi:hypothetical protein